MILHCSRETSGCVPPHYAHKRSRDLPELAIVELIKLLGEGRRVGMAINSKNRVLFLVNFCPEIRIKKSVRVIPHKASKSYSTEYVLNDRRVLLHNS
jgi:hypothetical protein